MDAIKFISASNDGQCNHCEPTVYRIHRNPVFKEGIKETIENFFEDTEADLEKGYEYSVGVLDEYGYVGFLFHQDIPLNRIKLFFDF